MVDICHAAKWWGIYPTFLKNIEVKHYFELVQIASK